MTDRQAKELTLSRHRRTMVFLENIERMMQEIGREYIFEMNTPATIEHMRLQVEEALRQVRPSVRIRNVEVVHDSITFDFEHD